jgi:hypothetical protein
LSHIAFGRIHAVHRYQEAAADGLAATGGRQRQRRSKAPTIFVLKGLLEYLVDFWIA